MVEKSIVIWIKKIKLDDVDLSQDKIELKDIIKTKTINALHNTTEPSRKGILAILFLQWIFLLIIWIIKV